MGASLGGGGGRRSRRQPFNDINVTPMVDVMLVLLIIFMVTAPMLTAGVTVDLPESKAAPLPGQDEPISVSITRDNKIYLQKTEVKLEQLGTKLRAIAGANKEARIFVRGDQAVDYGRIMSVVGEISAAGYPKIALETTEVRSPAAAPRQR